jgi:hypothetical protein
MDVVSFFVGVMCGAIMVQLLSIAGRSVQKAVDDYTCPELGPHRRSRCACGGRVRCVWCAPTCEDCGRVDFRLVEGGRR